jgi:hypothetical protein
LHQGLQGLPEQGAALQWTAKLLGASQEFIVEGDGGTHSHQHAAMRHYTHLGIIW